MPDTSSPTSVIIDTSHSPHARLRPVPTTAVRLTDTFWAPRRQVNRQVTLPSQYRLCEETGRMDNFRIAAGKKEGQFQGRFFNASDVYKWLEAAGWTLATDPDPELDTLVDWVIAEVGDAQQPDGYLDTYFMGERAAERWTNYDLHEGYCAGHLFQAAVAHHRATGKTALLDIATRLADHMARRFGPADQGKQEGADGHPEVEMALVELYRVTGERRYLDLAQFFIDVRGYGKLGRPYDRWGSEYHQDHRPVRDLTSVDGHAVRALYLNSGITDVQLETGEAGLDTALGRLWDHFSQRQVYVSGGAGSRYEGEAMGREYELPNARAYTETCAAIASVMWNWRMLARHADARYADLLEWTLYNAVLPGVALDGQTYFYQNPLADDGTHRRRPWFGTACCPPNIARTLAMLPGYFASVSDAGLWVHLYAANQTEATLPDGRVVRLTQATDYPWDGEIEMTVDGRGEFSLFLRIPGWCEAGAMLTINGEPWPGVLTSGSYAEVRRTWTPGDRVHLSLPMPPRRLEAHPYVEEDAGRVALTRGPLLYCVEQADNPGLDPRDIVLPADASITAEFDPRRLQGVTVLRVAARRVPPGEDWAGRLYRTASAPPLTQPGEPVEVVAIPYYAWANREPGRMQVWLRQVDRR